MPSVASNTKFRCLGCGAVLDFPGGVVGITDCPNCGKGEFEQIVVQVVCDFCATPNPSWEYPAGPFVAPTPSFPTPVDYASADSWGACDKCHALIEADDIKGLVDRAMEHHPQVTLLPKKMRPLLRDDIERFHRRFLAKRTGPARPIQEDI